MSPDASLHLGVYQCDAGGLTPAQRLDRLRWHLSGQSLDLLVCPELFMSGYNAGDDHQRLAETADGAFARAVGDLANEFSTAVIYGYPERGPDGVIYNSAAFIASDGRLIANHRKRLASPHSFEETTFTNGTCATLIEYRGLRIAVLICYEVEFPESVRAAAQAGAHLVAVPTALVDQWGVVAEKLVPARAFENGVWLAYANHAGGENGFSYLGGSRIVAPDGTEVAVAGTGDELITAPIDPQRVTAAQNRLPYLRNVHALIGG